jgi:hypothetical protein
MVPSRLPTLSHIATLAPYDERVEFAHGILLHTRQDVRVDIHCHADLLCDKVVPVLPSDGH